MNKTVRVCEEIMKQLVKAGFTNQVSKKSLEVAITLIRGGDPRTIKNWVRILTLLEYISPLNANVFQMNLTKVHGLIEMVVKERGQRKLL